MKGSKPVITICGFYGSGNSGDEAMLRTFVHQIRKRVPDCIFYVSANKFGTWKTNDLYYISGVDRTKLKISDMFILGGGDLSLGFGWNLLPFAKIENCKIVMASVGINQTWKHECVKNAIVENLKLCDKIFVRDQDSKDNLEKIGLQSEATTDVAIELLINDNLDIYQNVKHVSVCVREVAGVDNEYMIKNATSVINRILKEEYSISLLPMCASDRILIEQLTENNFDNTQIVYSTEPEHHKYVISRSDYLVSLGRLHPLIYATGVVVPMIAESYPLVKEYHKINAWMKYINQEGYYMPYGNAISQFEEKWELLKKHRNDIQQELFTQRKRLIDLNKKQFDEIASLIS